MEWFPAPWTARISHMPADYSHEHDEDDRNSGDRGLDRGSGNREADRCRPRLLEAQAEEVGVADVDEHSVGQHVSAYQALDVLTLEGRFDNRSLD